MTPDEILAIDRAHLWHPYTALDEKRTPLVVTGARGSRLTLADGRTLLDGNSSWWVAGIGHNHPRVVEAIAEQARKFCHVSLAGLTHEPAAALAAELAAVAPPGLSRVHFSDDGSTAVECAVKLAVQYQRQSGAPARTRLVALDAAFHGETLGCVSLSDTATFHSAFAPITFEVLRVGGDSDEAWARTLDALAKMSDTIAAVVVEPLLQGASGMRIYDPRHLRALRELTRERGILLIADEVFTGYGRTGRMWACDHAGVVPDVMCLGKTFSGGALPMAATLVSDKLLDAFRGGKERAFLHGHSFCGNPLGAAVARAVLGVMRDEDVVGQAARKAPKLRAAVEEVARRGGRNPRALGMAAAVDLDAGGYLGGAGWRAWDEGVRRGAYLRPLGDTMYLAPPLTIGDGDLDELCEIFVEAATTAMRAA